MPTYRGIDVWIENSQHQKLDHEDFPIDLVDDRTMAAKIKMPRNELYTVHCLSPISIFCEVFVATTPNARKRAARFQLDKKFARSKGVTDSSVDCAIVHGLRTPKRALWHGKLASVEIEVRRISNIVKDEPRGRYPAEAGPTEFSMIDDFDRPPWLVFHFEICVKDSPPASVMAAERIRKRRRMFNDQNRTSAKRNIEGSNDASEASCGRVRKFLQISNGSATIGDSIHADSDQLTRELQKEEDEEQRLLQKLQERVQAKKARNMELRRLLGETP